LLEGVPTRREKKRAKKEGGRKEKERRDRGRPNTHRFLSYCHRAWSTGKKKGPGSDEKGRERGRRVSPFFIPVMVIKAPGERKKGGTCESKSPLRSDWAPGRGKKKGKGGRKRNHEGLPPMECFAFMKGPAKGRKEKRKKKKKREGGRHFFLRLFSVFRVVEEEGRGKGGGGDGLRFYVVYSVANIRFF